MSLEQNCVDPVKCDSPELCMKRLSKKVSEVEIILGNQEGRTNQMKNERDAQRVENERLKKEITKLNNELLRERTNSAQKERQIRDLQNDTTMDGKVKKADNWGNLSQQGAE